MNKRLWVVQGPCLGVTSHFLQILLTEIRNQLQFELSRRFYAYALGGGQQWNTMSGGAKSYDTVLIRGFKLTEYTLVVYETA